MYISDLFSSKMSEIVPRSGPTTHDYLTDFLQFLRQRMGYTSNSFLAPLELRKIFEDMTLAKFPRALWQALMNVALRVAAQARENGIMENFKMVLTQVTIGLWYWYTEYWIVRGVLTLLSFLSPTIITDIVMILYRFVASGVEKLWQFVKARVSRQSRLGVYSYRALEN